MLGFFFLFFFCDLLSDLTSEQQIVLIKIRSGCFVGPIWDQKLFSKIMSRSMEQAGKELNKKIFFIQFTNLKVTMIKMSVQLILVNSQGWKLLVYYSSSTQTIYCRLVFMSALGCRLSEKSHVFQCKFDRAA